MTRNEAISVNRVQITNGLGYLVKEFELYPKDQGYSRVLNTGGLSSDLYARELEYRVKRHAVIK